MQLRVRTLFYLSILAVLAACQQQPAPPGMKLGKPYVVEGATYYPEYDPAYDKIGMASWYGPGFHGKYTASGEIYNQNDLTAAHPTLPMPCLVRVTNLQNGKHIVVRINDRGPFKRNRIIDLSKKAAETLGITATAKVRVQFLTRETEQLMASIKNSPGKPIDMAQYNSNNTMQVVRAENDTVVATTDMSTGVGTAAPVMSVGSDDLNSPAPPRLAQAAPVTASRPVHLIRDAMADEPPAKSPTELKPLLTPTAVKSAVPGYYVQAGSFSSEDNANKLKTRLNDMRGVAVDKVGRSGRDWWRVRLGPYKVKEIAEQALKLVTDHGVKDAHIIHE